MNTVGLIGVVVVAAFIFLRFRNYGPGAKNIDGPTLRSMLKDKNVKLIDVRTPGEVAQGKIKNASNININSADFKQKVSNLDKSKTYVLYCRSGARSTRAARVMMKMGFEDVYNLQGGYMSYSK
ncbi:MAG TPA: rhodanese-like domain-containing protein [Saprospiraceae bacterium]|nr:rhodanese-like domain-containing protein [Saprospiraceae bacterium]